MVDGTGGAVVPTLGERFASDLDVGRLKVYAVGPLPHYSEVPLRNTALRLGVSHGYDWVALMQYFHRIDPDVSLQSQASEAMNLYDSGMVLVTPPTCWSFMYSTWSFVWDAVGYFAEGGAMMSSRSESFMANFRATQLSNMSITAAFVVIAGT